MILQNISRRVVGNVLINISPSDILPILLKPERFRQKCHADLTAVSIKGLRYIWIIETTKNHKFPAKK